MTVLSSSKRRYSVLHYLLYFFLSVAVHGLFFLIMSIELKFAPEYQELDISIPNDTPVFLTPPVRRILPNIVKDIKKVNETVEVKKEEEEEEIEEEVEEEVVPVVTTEGETEQLDNVPDIEYAPFYAADKRPAFLKRATQVYPFKEKRLGIEGVVIIEVDLDAQGVLRDYRILKSGGEGFDQSTINMIEQSTYSPGFKDGKAIPVRMRFTIRFSIQG